MNKVLFGAVLSLLLVSCNNSPEKKANALIKEEMKKTLYFPKTYEAIETQIDSAFSPFDDPAFYDKVLEAYQMTDYIKSLDSKIKYAKSEMAINSNFFSEFTRNEYQEAKEEYDKNIKEKEFILKKAVKLKKEFETMMLKNPQFIGFKARHRFRAKNNAGQVLIGENKFLFDKDLTKIIASYNMNNDELSSEGNEYSIVRMFYETIFEAYCDSMGNKNHLSLPNY